MERQWIWLVLALALVGVSCAAPWLRGPIQPASRESHPGADAVVLKRTGHLEFLSTSDPAAGYELTVAQRIQILTPGGRQHARIAIPLDHWTRLVDVGARSYDAQGSEPDELSNPVAMKLFPAELTTINNTQAWALYTDSKVAVFDVVGAQVGRVLEVYYRVRVTQGFSLPRWTFDDLLPVVESTFEVAVPEGWDLHWGYSADNTPAPFEPERTPDGGGEILRWALRGLDALESEPYGLPLSQAAKQLQIGVARVDGAPAPFASWAGIARFYGELTSELMTPPEAALDELEEFPRSHAGETEAERIYRFVRDRVRYVAVERGLGALKPHAADQVFRSRWGDCKDMTTLALTLLRARGVDAYPALVVTRNYSVFHHDVPAVDGFNHVVVAIPEKDGMRFVDPTAKYVPFDGLPWAIQGQPVLVVREGATLAQVPAMSADENTTHVTWEIDGTDVELTAQIRGEPTGPWRALRGSPANDRQLRRAVESRFLGAPGELELVEAEMTQDDGHGIELRARFRHRGLHELNPGTRLVHLQPFFGVAPEVRVPEGRKSVVVVGYPETMTTELQLRLSDGTRLAHLPQPVQLDQGFATYDFSSRSDGSAVTLTQTLIYRDPVVAADELTELRRMSEAITKTGRDAVIVATEEGR